MKRKLVKQGAATLMVSLPSKWIKANNLGKGSEIDLEEQGSKLIIDSSNIMGTKKEIEISLTSLTESSVRTFLTNIYRLGYDKIKINYSNPKFFEFIKENVEKNLLGFEIIVKNRENCVIENITEPSSEQFDNIFSKVWLNIDELFDLLIKSISGEKADFEDTERKIQQFDNFCRRIITKKGNNQITLWAFHSELIHGQRELYHLLKYLKSNKSGSIKESISFVNEVRKIFVALKEAYEKKDNSLIEKIHETEKNIVYNKGYNNLKKINPIVVHHLMSATRNFYLASSPLMGMNLDILY